MKKSINIISIIITLYGAYICITCDINIIALPVFLLGVFGYYSTREKGLYSV